MKVCCVVLIAAALLGGCANTEAASGCQAVGKSGKDAADVAGLFPPAAVVLGVVGFFSSLNNTPRSTPCPAEATASAK